MPHRFLLIKMLQEYDAIVEGEKLNKAFKRRLISDLEGSEVEFVHICTDTSADKALREHSSYGFGTYFLAGFNICETTTDPDTMILHLIKHVDTSSEGSVIDVNTNYQVFTYQ